LLLNDAGREKGRSLAELLLEIECLAPPRGRNLIAQRRASRYFVADLGYFNAANFIQCCHSNRTFTA
jgi:hypothetical protein